MHAGVDRHEIAGRYRKRALSAGVALVVALAAAGCASSASTTGSSSSSSGSSNVAAPIVTGEQVVTSCFQNYFYNGILPKSSAEVNCRSCVVEQLRKLGIQPPSGQTVMDMLTGDRLSSSDIQTLQSACNESDASAQ